MGMTAFVFFKQKTAYEMRISDWSSDVCSSDLIGWGLPAAIGAKLALPDRPVVALIGDGSAMYTCQALWTAARYNIGVAFVILNNSSYRILKQRVNAMRGHAAQTDIYVGMDLNEPAVDFVGLAHSLGIAADRATTEIGRAHV